MHATLGRDSETGQPVRISDIDRQRGLYVLGTPGTGKTTLLLNLIDQDIAHGHGLFFLDPHGDAIRQIVESGRHAERLARDLILLDPTREAASFGINLLACSNPANLNARLAAYNRTYRVFERLFGNEWGDYGTWGVWLQEMLQYTIYTFIENQGYTLADVPLFLTDPAFRDRLVSNIRYDHAVARYWQHDFGALPPPMQAERVQAFKTRMQILLHAHVRHIVGQSETTIDFGESMRRKAIILVSLPSSLPPDVKRMIGAILLSELLYAVEARYHLPARQRQHFGIYVDEVQHFANSDDFNTLFTEARKYGIAATIAHQERYGQLADNRKMAGATAAAANLVCLQLSHRDAEELGPVFAEPPPTETRREPELVISRYPVADLLRGHKNPRINAFAQRYLRPLHEGRADAREDMEGERLIRMDFMDEATLYRLEEQAAGLLGHTPDAVSDRQQALARAEGALLAARGQTEKMLSLYERSRRYRASLRYLDAFLTAVMEGELAPGNEDFSLLISRICSASHIPEPYVETLQLYISLLYGDPTRERAIPVALARAHGVAPALLTSTLQAAEASFQQEKAPF